MNLRIVVNCDHDTNNDINGRHGAIISYSASKGTHYILCRLDRVDDETPAALVPLTVGCVKLWEPDPDADTPPPPPAPPRERITGKAATLKIGRDPRAKKRTARAR
jgi:hypothetical protein